MAQFRAFSPTVEVNGDAVHSFIDGMSAFKSKAIAILAEAGITDPRPGLWYPQQAWLDAFKRIAENIGPATIFTIGLKIPQNAQFPPESDSLVSALAAIDVAYHMNHRGGEIGRYQCVPLGDRLVKMVCNNPYPCEFDRGIISAFCARFRLKGSALEADVAHDDSAPCRKNGADSCTYLITW
jgi:hypothetical protein